MHQATFPRSTELLKKLLCKKSVNDTAIFIDIIYENIHNNALIF